ncbi:hypothetical protein ACWYRQ_10150 [Clostridioides difficile]
MKPKFAHEISFNNKIVYKANSIEDYEKVKNACEQYKLIDESEYREGICYKFLIIMKLLCYLYLLIYF